VIIKACEYRSKSTSKYVNPETCDHESRKTCENIIVKAST